MTTKINLKFFVAILLLAFCTSSCSKKSEETLNNKNKPTETSNTITEVGESVIASSSQSETLAPVITDQEVCTSTNENGSTEEYSCQTGQPVDCENEINANTSIEQLYSGKFSNCWATSTGVVGISRRGVAILPILIEELYLYPNNPYLLDIIIKMGPDAADAAPHLIRLLDRYNNHHENYNKALQALAGLGEDGTVAIPYLIDRLNYLRDNKSSSQDIEEITSYLAELGKFQPESVRPTLLDLTKDYPTTAKNALALIKKSARLSDPSWADSNTFGVYTNYCQTIYKEYSNTPTSRLPDTANHQPYAYCIANILGKRGIKALPELINMANSDDMYLRYLAVKYIGELGNEIDTETREKIIALKDKKYGKHGDFSMDWDVNYYMLGQFPEFRN